MPDWGQIAGGGLGGAAAGATLGSFFPVVGTGIGALAGGALGALGGLFSPSKEGGVQRGVNLTPEEQNIMQLLLQQGQQGLQNPYSGFDDIANYARQGFNQQTIPSLIDRFSGMGNNALSSGALHSQLGAAGSNFEQGLAALRANYGQQNQQNSLQQLSLGLSPAFQTYYQQRQPGFNENLLNSTIQAAPSIYQSYMLSQALQKLGK